MTEVTRNVVDSHDWAARASEALAQAKKFAARIETIRSYQKSRTLRVAADMKNLLMAKEPAA
jgi:hypothetical protein